jgi:hypothetical protein
MASSNLARGLAVCCFAVLLAGGCGKGDWGYLSGTVKLNGQPVGPGTITFEPIDAERAGSFASFGEDGRYTVVSAGRKEGARIGEYRVLIQGGTAFGEESVGPRPPSKIPARYTNPKTSDLKVTIESGSKTHDFELKP